MPVLTRNSEQSAAAQRYDQLHQRDFRNQTLFHWPIANAIGMSEAILLEIIHDWSESNSRLCKSEYFHDDEWWTRGSYEKWATNYPALGSTRSIQRRFLELEEGGYIISFRPKGGEKFYRVNKEKVGLLLMPNNLMPISDLVDSVSCQNRTTDVPESDYGRAKSGCPTIYINNINKLEQENRTLTREEETFDLNSTEITTESNLEIKIINQEHPATRMEARFRHTINEIELRKQLVDVYNAEIPRINNCFMPITAITHQDWLMIKQDYLPEHGMKVVDLLRDSLIFIREQENDFWRKQPWVLRDLMQNGKLVSFQTKHFAGMQASIPYRNRVNGVARSQDPTRYATFSPDMGHIAVKAAQAASDIQIVEEMMAGVRRRDAENKARKELAKQQELEARGQ